MDKNRKVGILIIVVVILVLGILAYVATDGNLSVKNTPPTKVEPASNTTVQNTSSAENTPNTRASSTAITKDSSKILNDTSATYNVKVDYPVGNTPGAEIVAKYIKDDAKNFEEKANNENSSQGSSSGSGTGAYEKITKYQYFQHENSVSYFLQKYEYTGGANGITVVKTFVFNKNGNQLSLDDVVGANPSQKQAFLQSVKNKLLAKSSDVGVFKDIVNKLTLNDLDNFYLTDSGIMVAFSQYNVAPGSAGIVTVVVPYSELQ
jgi:hypothetical protein